MPGDCRKPEIHLSIEDVQMNPNPSPFHRGEQELQERMGVRNAIEPWAQKVVRPWLPEQHRDFYEQLPFVVVSARDEEERPWATLLAGEPGFASSPDPERLEVRAKPVPGDALESALRPGRDVGLLGLEFHTRRRNRLNGRISAAGESGLLLEVGQAFGNCPQYIHSRAWERRVASKPERFVHQRFSPSLTGWIERANTFFIATGTPSGGAQPSDGMDASHRGGSPGFVRVTGKRELVFPDYAGNNHYNTLGNLQLDDRAGLLFVDFEHGHLLQLTGRAWVDWEADTSPFPGALRLVRFELDEAVELLDVLALRFESEQSTQPLRVTAKERESEGVTSFTLEPTRNAAVLHSAGQHLPISAILPGDRHPTRRTYSLSNAPGDGSYRITVKRQPGGLFSNHLHDSVDVGDLIDAEPPSGDFVVDTESERPLLLIGAGVGITPLISMMHEAKRTGRPALLVHSVRDGQHHPLRDEVQDLTRGSDHLEVHFVYSQPLESDHLDSDYQTRGRIDGKLLSSLDSELRSDVYLCGPLPFMASLRDQLEALGMPAERIFSETFGPA